MSLTTNPWLERQVCRDRLRLTPSQKSTSTPVECPFTATQARNQRIPLQEPIASEGADLTTENVNLPAGIKEEGQGSPLTLTQGPPPTLPGFDFQSLLLALFQQPAQLPQGKKRYQGVKELDSFSRRSPDNLYAFIFQCQIYFCACKEEFREDTEKVFFVISYLWGVALDYFELFINKSDPYQNFDFLEDWTVFIQKLLNIFGSYLPEDDDKDTIVSIPFPNDGRAVNYFIQFAKYQNCIHWDDCSLQKVVKDTLPTHIRDELHFSHKNIFSFEGLKRAVMRIDNDYWRRQ